MPRLLTLFALVALVGGCDSATDSPAACVGGAEPACPPPAPDEVVAGVNLTALFAAPTDAERALVASRLDQTGEPDSTRITQAVATSLATDARDGTRYVLLDLRGAGGRAVTFALARVPANSVGQGRPLPVLFILPDGDGDASEADFVASGTTLDRTTVQIVVAARGASLTARGTAPGSPSQIVRSSAVPSDPYRADVADLLALVDQLALVPRADAERLGAIGAGRGGSVALLAAERRPGPFEAVATMGAPTSLFDATFRADARDVLLGTRSSALPAADALLAPVRALQRGEIDLAEARLRLLETSPVAGADRLPATIAYHSTTDNIVPFAHIVRLGELGGSTLDDPRRFESVEDLAHDQVIGNASVLSLLSDFMAAYL